MHRWQCDRSWRDLIATYYSGVGKTLHLLRDSMSTGGIFANEGALQNTLGNFSASLIKVCNLGILKLIRRHISVKTLLFWIIFYVFTHGKRFSLNLLLLGLGHSSKGLGTNLKLETNKIAWIIGPWTLNPHLILCWSLKLQLWALSDQPLWLPFIATLSKLALKIINLLPTNGISMGGQNP